MKRFLFDLRAYPVNSDMARLQAMAWACIIGGIIFLIQCVA